MWILVTLCTGCSEIIAWVEGKEIFWTLNVNMISGTTTAGLLCPLWSVHSYSIFSDSPILCHLYHLLRTTEKTIKTCGKKEIFSQQSVCLISNWKSSKNIWKICVTEAGIRIKDPDPVYKKKYGLGSGNIRPDLKPWKVWQEFQSDISLSIKLL